MKKLLVGIILLGCLFSGCAYQKIEIDDRSKNVTVENYKFFCQGYDSSINTKFNTDTEKK